MSFQPLIKGDKQIVYHSAGSIPGTFQNLNDQLVSCKDSLVVNFAPNLWWYFVNEYREWTVLPYVWGGRRVSVATHPIFFKRFCEIRSEDIIFNNYGVDHIAEAMTGLIVDDDDVVSEVSPTMKSEYMDKYRFSMQNGYFLYQLESKGILLCLAAGSTRKRAIAALRHSYQCGMDFSKISGRVNVLINCVWTCKVLTLDEISGNVKKKISAVTIGGFPDVPVTSLDLYVGPESYDGPRYNEYIATVLFWIKSGTDIKFLENQGKHFHLTPTVQVKWGLTMGFLKINFCSFSYQEIVVGVNRAREQLNC
jgi:hypothetical protein